MLSATIHGPQVNTARYQLPAPFGAKGPLLLKMMTAWPGSTIAARKLSQPAHAGKAPTLRRDLKMMTPVNAIPAASGGQINIEEIQPRSLIARVTSGLVASGRYAATAQTATSNASRIGIETVPTVATIATRPEPPSSRRSIAPSWIVHAIRKGMPIAESVIPISMLVWWLA